MSATSTYGHHSPQSQCSTTINKSNYGHHRYLEYISFCPVMTQLQNDDITNNNNNESVTINANNYKRNKNHSSTFLNKSKAANEIANDEMKKTETRIC